MKFDVDEFSRGVAVAALALLAVWAEVPRDAILDYFAWLAREGLERRTSYVWGALAAESADIEALDVFPDLRRAYDEGFIDPQVIGRSELDDVEASPRGAVLGRMKERHPPIDDVIELTVWFGPEAPAGNEGNWVQTVRGKGYLTMLRLYGPLAPWFEKAWKPGDFELVTAK